MKKNLLFLKDSSEPYILILFTKEVFIQEVFKKTVPWTYVISYLNPEQIAAENNCQKESKTKN